MIATHRTGRSGPPSPMETYLRQIDATPLLSAEQERELAYRIEDGDAEARDHLVRANLRLVVSIARQYQGRGVDLQDLIAEGNLGLLRAAEAFDAAMQTRFSTYAAFWIKQSMRRCLTATGRAVRLPAYMATLLARWREAAAALQEGLGRPPADEEVAGRLGLSARQVRLVKKAIRIHNAQPQEAPDRGGQSLEDLVADGRTEAPGARLENAEEVEQVLRLVEGLGERESAVLRLRFGLDGGEPKTLQEIGDALGLTRERVRQIERLALAQLNELLQTV